MGLVSASRRLAPGLVRRHRLALGRRRDDRAGQGELRDNGRGSEKKQENGGIQEWAHDDSSFVKVKKTLPSSRREKKAFAPSLAKRRRDHLA
jgi:hypothetical protein